MPFTMPDRGMSRDEADHLSRLSDNLFIKLLICTLVYEPNLVTFICVIGKSKLPVSPKLNPTL